MSVPEFLEAGGQTWLGNLNGAVPPVAAALLQIAAAMLCGTIIGLERRSRHKPAGMRTVTLICLGSTLFTLTSLALTDGGGDPSRVAAQVVTGIGFLGAGTIIRHRGAVHGLTTAATIWVVAAIGVLIGSGYVMPAVGLSLVVLALLRAQSSGEDEEDERPKPTPDDNNNDNEKSLGSL